MTLLIGLIVSIALFFICFISTESYISAAFVFVVSLLYFVIYANKVMKNKDEKKTRFMECFQFVNNFLISLSIKGHASGALASALESQNEETKELLNSLDSDDPMDKVRYLKNYFRFDVYYLFIDLVTLYNEEGGDILQMSSHLLNQIRELEEYIVNVERINKNTLLEFAILWTFSLTVLAILRFSLDDFFKYVVGNNFYQISVVLILLFTLASIHIAISKVTKFEIRGWNNEK